MFSVKRRRCSFFRKKNNHAAEHGLLVRDVERSLFGKINKYGDDGKILFKTAWLPYQW